jgi:hypothetical protein
LQRPPKQPHAMTHSCRTTHNSPQCSLPPSAPAACLTPRAPLTWQLLGDLLAPVAQHHLHQAPRQAGPASGRRRRGRQLAILGGQGGEAGVGSQGSLATGLVFCCGQLVCSRRSGQKGSAAVGLLEWDALGQMSGKRGTAACSVGWDFGRGATERERIWHLPYKQVRCGQSDRTPRP